MAPVAPSGLTRKLKINKMVAKINKRYDLLFKITFINTLIKLKQVHNIDIAVYVGARENQIIAGLLNATHEICDIFLISGLSSLRVSMVPNIAKDTTSMNSKKREYIPKCGSEVCNLFRI